MTQFEYVTVAVSMVLALTFARILAALPHVLAPGRRYWIHSLWCLVMVAAPIQFWWAIWTYHEIDSWTFRGFASVMLTPALMYLTVNTLVSDNPSATESWRAHFFARRRVIFSLFLAFVLSIVLRQFVVLGDVGRPLVAGGPGSLLFALPYVAVGCVGLVTGKEWVHRLLSVGVAGMFLLSFVTLLAL